MTPDTDSPYLNLLRDRINLRRIPFSDRGSRLMVFRGNSHLVVRLAERWFRLDGQLSSYRQRPPIIDELCFTDGQGQPLPIEVSTYPHRVECKTPSGVFDLVFVDQETLLITLPAVPCGVSFLAHVDQAQSDRRGGVLRLTGDVRRSVVYTTNARLVENRVDSPSDGAQVVHLRFSPDDDSRSLLLNITPRLGFNRYVLDAGEAIGHAADRWHAWFARAPAPPEAYRAQYYYAWWIMRAGLISTRFYTTREAMTPSKIHYVGVWQWDAYFHALAYRHLDMQLAKDQLRILLDHQRPDGMIPDAVHDEGTVTRLSFPVEADVTKPPLLAWAAWKLYQSDQDREFLDEIYEPIVRWNNWWFEHNDLDGDGLCEYQHPFSSGLDDSPLWDQGMPVTSPDLNVYLCLQEEALSRIATVLGEPQAAVLWQERADNIAQRMVRELWDPAAGLFWARRHGEAIRVRTPFSLFPLLTARMPNEILRRLLDHLTDERSFWSRHPVPTVAMDDPHYNPTQMWRGPTWMNVNFLLIEGLRRCGRFELAETLRTKTLDMAANSDDLCEYFHPETGECVGQAASTFGWSAALFIDLALQAGEAAGASPSPG
jgi:putative isomerase